MSICLVGRGSGTISFRRRQGVVLDLLVNSRVLRMGMRLILPVSKGKMKTKQGPKFGAKEQQSRGQGEQQKKDMSKVRCFDGALCWIVSQEFRHLRQK
jgi:hypothetical protein